MKKILAYFIIICLIFSILPFGLTFNMPKNVSYSCPNTSFSVHYAETTINMSTSCVAAKFVCKICSFIRRIKIRLAEYTTFVSGKLLEVKGTKYRKIITFESNGDGEDPCIYI